MLLMLLYNAKRFFPQLGKRKALNLSQTAVAKQLGVTRQAVSKFEKGESSPTLDVVFSYANAIGIDLFGSLKD